MNINSIAVVLGFAGLLAGGIGLAAHNLGDNSAADPVPETATAHVASWPPPPGAAGVEFHDEMVALLTPRTSPRSARAPADQQELRQDVERWQQAVPPESAAAIRSVRTGRVRGSRSARFYEIEFVDAEGRQIVRRYEAAQGKQRRRGEREVAPAETYGYSPRPRRDRVRRQYR